MSDRKTISVDSETYATLYALKRDGESWSATLSRAAEALESQAGDVNANALTVSHIDDIAARVSRQTAEEVENRLTRR